MITMIARHIVNNKAYINNKNRIDSRYTDFQNRGPLGAVLHSIGTPQPKAVVIADYFNNPSVEASVHMVLQDDGTCYQLAPDNYRMWHVGGSANNTHMGIEITEPDCIWYDANNGYKVHIRNTSKALTHVAKTYGHAVDLFADLCIHYGWDPLEDGVILSHKECCERGIGSNHGDPEHLWDALSTGYTMNGFRRDVAKKVAEKREEENRKAAEVLEKQIEAVVTRVLNQREKSLKDNDCGSWSDDARKWAVAKGIVQGIGKGSDSEPNYAWEAPVTREQMVTMLFRALVVGTDYNWSE